MPCLNEAETIKTCITKAARFLEENRIDGEILIADNGSTDGSADIAKNLGARVTEVSQTGYGHALIAGAKNAYGKYIIMGDSDDSYDFGEIMPFLIKLREGYDLVMGNRYAGDLSEDAMPLLNRYLGTPVISMLGRVLFKSKITDFNCGLRGYNKDAFLDLDLKMPGMEYASEMIAKAQTHHLKICEVPTTLHKDGRSRPPHLRPIRDGLRHVGFLIGYRFIFFFRKI